MAKQATGQKLKGKVPPVNVSKNAVENNDKQSSSKEQLLKTIRTLVSIAGLAFAVWGIYQAYSDPGNRKMLALNATIWSLGPPLWMILEFCVLWPRLEGKPDKKEDLKHGQALATAFWAGVGALLIIIYTNDPDFEPSKAEQAIIQRLDKLNVLIQTQQQTGQARASGSIDAAKTSATTEKTLKQ